MEVFVSCRGEGAGGKQHNKQDRQIGCDDFLLTVVPGLLVDVVEVGSSEHLNEKEACHTHTEDVEIILEIPLVLLDEVEFKNGNKDGKD